MRRRTRHESSASALLRRHAECTETGRLYHLHRQLEALAGGWLLQDRLLAGDREAEPQGLMAAHVPPWVRQVTWLRSFQRRALLSPSLQEGVRESLNSLGLLLRIVLGSKRTKHSMLNMNTKPPYKWLAETMRCNKCHKNSRMSSYGRSDIFQEVHLCYLTSVDPTALSSSRILKDRENSQERFVGQRARENLESLFSLTASCINKDTWLSTRPIFKERCRARSDILFTDNNEVLNWSREVDLISNTLAFILEAVLEARRPLLDSWQPYIN